MLNYLTIFFIFLPFFSFGQFPFLQTQKGIQSIVYSYAFSDASVENFATIKTEFFNKKGQLVRISYPNGAEIQYQYEGNRVFSAATWETECPLQYDVETIGDSQRVWVSNVSASQVDCSTSGASVIYSTHVYDSLFLTVPKNLPIQGDSHFFTQKILGKQTGEWTIYKYFSYPGSNGLELQSIVIRTQTYRRYFLEKTYQRSRVPIRHIYLESELIFDEYGSFICTNGEKMPKKEQFSHTFDSKGQVVGYRSTQKFNGKQGIWKRKIRYYSD